MKKNKILKTLIAIILLISLEAVAIAATTGVVNVDTVRVRKKATTDSDIVELVSIGDKITITGEEGNWYKVKVGKVTGYIRKDLLTVEGKVTTPEETDSTEAQPPVQTEETDSTTTQPPVQTEEPNNNGDKETSGEVSEEKPLENSDVTIEKNNKTISTIKKTGNLSAGNKIKLNQETKIKILPSANSSNIAKLAAETEVTVLEVINRWCRIEAGEYAGWVRIDQ